MSDDRRPTARPAIPLPPLCDVRTVRIELYRNDDPLYRFGSKRGPADREPVDRETLERQLDALGPAPLPRVVFSGSDPLEHPEFPTLVDRCRAVGVQNFRLVTDGYGLAHEDARRFLADSGIQEVVVVFPSADPDAYARAMQSERRYEACRTGIERAAEEGFELLVVLPLIAHTAESIETTLEWLEQVPVSGVLVEYPAVGRVSKAARDALLDYPTAAKLVANVFGANRRRRRTSGVHERWVIPPCAADGALDDYGDLFNQRNRHYRARNADKLARVPACAECDLSAACLGVERDYLEVFPETPFRPIPLEEANAWYTKPINRLEEIPFRRFSPYDSGTERSGTLGLLRINGHCNMGCSFCFVDLSHPDVAQAALTDEIDTLATRGVTDLVLSGGEPTLHPALPDVIAYARTKGFESIELQSNGVRIASADYARSLADAGLDIACISLHSHRAEESDRITKRPRAFGRTVQAIHNLRSVGVWTRISHVINRLNYKELPEFVRYARAEWPEGKVDICFAIAQEMSSQSSTWILPTFSEIRPYVREALDYCLGNEIEYSGLIGNGGYPPCMLDGELKYYENALTQIHTSGREAWYKAPRCATCQFDDRCVGIRRAYVDTHGDAEITPF